MKTICRRRQPQTLQYGVCNGCNLSSVGCQDPFLYSKRAVRRNLSGQSAKSYIISPVEKDPSGSQCICAVISPACSCKDDPLPSPVFFEIIVGTVRNGQSGALHKNKRRNADHFTGARVALSHLSARQYIFHRFSIWNKSRQDTMLLLLCPRSCEYCRTASSDCPAGGHSPL